MHGEARRHPRAWEADVAALIILLATVPLAQADVPSHSPITASSTMDERYLAEFALDGDVSTRWASASAGADPEWLRRVYGFALVPDVVLYLRVEVDDLVSRVISGGGFDFWESGMDAGLADNLYDSFRAYQTRIIEQLDRMAEEYGFVTIDASRSVPEVFADLKTEIARII